MGFDVPMELGEGSARTPSEGLGTLGVTAREDDQSPSPPHRQKSPVKQATVASAGTKEDTPPPRTPIKATRPLKIAPAVAVRTESKGTPIASAPAPIVEKSQEVVPVKPLAKRREVSPPRPVASTFDRPQAVKIHPKAAPITKPQLFTPPETTRHNARFDRPMEHVAAEAHRNVFGEGDQGFSQNALSVIKRISDTMNADEPRVYKKYEHDRQEIDHQILGREFVQVRGTHSLLRSCGLPFRSQLGTMALASSTEDDHPHTNAIRTNNQFMGRAGSFEDGNRRDDSGPSSPIEVNLA